MDFFGFNDLHVLLGATVSAITFPKLNLLLILCYKKATFARKIGLFLSRGE